MIEHYMMIKCSAGSTLGFTEIFQHRGRRTAPAPAVASSLWQRRGRQIDSLIFNRS